MHNYLTIATASTIAFSTVATVLPATSQAQDVVATVNTNTKLYKEANKNKKIKTVKKSTKVTVVRKTGTWTKVKYGAKTGYILTKYLTFVLTATEEESGAASKGKDLLKDVDAFNKLADDGKIEELYDDTYDKLSEATNKYADTVENLNVSDEVKKKLTEQYINVAQETLDRFANEMDAWRYISQTKDRIKNFKYDSAKTSYDDALKAVAQGETLRTEKGYDSIPISIQNKLQTELDTLKERFTKSTYEQMNADNHSTNHYTAKNGMEFITSTNPFKSSDGRIFTNGFKTVKGINKSGYRKVSFDKGTFKKVTFTIALGDYWNTHNYSGKVTVTVAGKEYKLSDGDNPITATVDISSKSSVVFKQDSKLNDIAFTDIVFYR